MIVHSLLGRHLPLCARSGCTHSRRFPQQKEHHRSQRRSGSQPPTSSLSGRRPQGRQQQRQHKPPERCQAPAVPQHAYCQPPNYEPPRPPPRPSTMERYRSEATTAAHVDEPSAMPLRLRSSSTAPTALPPPPLLLLPPLLPFRPAPFPRPRRLTCPPAPPGKTAAPAPCVTVEPFPPFCSSSTG